jgi:hypothetical protein
MDSTVLWVVTPCSSDIARRFGGRSLNSLPGLPSDSAAFYPEDGGSMYVQTTRRYNRQDRAPQTYTTRAKALRFLVTITRTPGAIMKLPIYCESLATTRAYIVTGCPASCFTCSPAGLSPNIPTQVLFPAVITSVTHKLTNKTQT